MVYALSQRFLATEKVGISRETKILVNRKEAGRVGTQFLPSPKGKGFPC